MCLDEGSIALLTLAQAPDHRLADPEEQQRGAQHRGQRDESGDRSGAQVTLVDLPHVDLGNQAEAEVGDRLEGCQHPAPGIVAADHRARTPGERRSHRVCRRTAEGDRIVRLLRATRGRQKHDEVAGSAGELYLGCLADPLLAQEAMRFQDLRKGTRRRLLALGSSRRFEMRKRFHQPRLALRDVDETRPLAVERRLVNHADRRRADDQAYADHDENEQSEASVFAHAILPNAAGPRLWFSWRAAA